MNNDFEQFLPDVRHELSKKLINSFKIIPTDKVEGEIKEDFL